MVIHHTNCTADVLPFLPELGTTEKVQIITGAIAYDHPDGKRVILIVNQALYIPALHDNLVCDNQCCMNDVVIDSCPKYLSENLTDDTHTLKFRNHDNFTIPMDLRGSVSCLPTRLPTKREYNECRHIEMTADHPEWDPHAMLFDENEVAVSGEEGFLKQASKCQSIMEPRTDAGSLFDAKDISKSVSDIPCALSVISNSLNDHLFVSAICSAVAVTYEDFVKTTTSTEPTRVRISTAETKPRYRLTPVILSQKWNVGLEAAKRTLRVTTQKGIRTAADLSIARCWGTNDRRMRYKQLKTDLFTDDTFANIASTRGNTGGQVYTNATDWVKIYPTPSKGGCHEMFDLLTHREGIPDTLIPDQAKEETMRQMRKKVRQARVH
jgi:hypothetical protein